KEELKEETTRPPQNVAEHTVALKEFHTDRLDSVSEDICGLSKDASHVKSQMAHLENELQKTAIETCEIKEETASLNLRLHKLEENQDDLETRPQRNNHHFLGTIEGQEEKDIINFLQKLLLDIFKLDPQLPPLNIERAHRMPGTRRQKSEKPRPIIFKLLNFSDKVMLMNTARKVQTLMYKGHKRSLFPDFSDELNNKRVAFSGIKQIPRTIIKYLSTFTMDLAGSMCDVSPYQQALNIKGKM
uniref:L1 transposable element RRM domain-containing protein n=1 Tax=Gopherus agassizii TaxID=38772 RepID=A0A452IDA2_9SAUR